MTQEKIARAQGAVDDLVERVARALAGSQGTWTCYVVDANAAIAAVREYDAEIDREARKALEEE